MPLWLIVAFPCLIALTKGIYNGFYNSWCILLFPFLASWMPIQFATVKKQQLFYFILLFCILSGIFIQYRLSSQQITALEEKFKDDRQFYDEVLDTLIKTKAHYFTFLINEDYAIFIRSLIFHSSVLGWSSLIVSLYFIGGLIIAILGIIGIYLGKTFDEVKKRPLYILSEVTDN